MLLREGVLIAADHLLGRISPTVGLWPALEGEPRTAYQVSFPLFGDDLKPSARRFAVAETLSHLERLVLEGGARRHETAGGVTYTAAQ